MLTMSAQALTLQATVPPDSVPKAAVLTTEQDNPGPHHHSQKQSRLVSLPLPLLLKIFACTGSGEQEVYIRLSRTCHELNSISRHPHALAGFLLAKYGTHSALFSAALYLPSWLEGSWRPWIRCQECQRYPLSRQSSEACLNGSAMVIDGQEEFNSKTNHVVQALYHLGATWPRHILQKLKSLWKQGVLQISQSTLETILNIGTHELGYSPSSYDMNDDLEFQFLVMQQSTLPLKHFVATSRYAPNIWHDYHDDKLNMFTSMVPKHPPPRYDSLLLQDTELIALLIRHGLDARQLSSRLLSCPNLPVASIPPLLQAGLVIDQDIIQQAIRLNSSSVPTLLSYVPKPTCKPVILKCLPYLVCRPTPELFQYLSRVIGPLTAEDVTTALSTQTCPDSVFRTIFAERSLIFLPRLWVIDELTAIVGVQTPFAESLLAGCIDSMQETGEAKPFCGVDSIPVLANAPLHALFMDESAVQEQGARRPLNTTLSPLNCALHLLDLGVSFTPKHLQKLMRHKQHELSERLIQYLDSAVYRDVIWKDVCIQIVREGIKEGVTGGGPSYVEKSVGRILSRWVKHKEKR